MKPGDRILAKLEPGLGNWQMVTLVSMHRDHSVVELKDGARRDVPNRRIKAQRSRVPLKARVRRCSYCKKIGHDLRRCPALKEMAASVKSGPVNTITRPFLTERPDTAPVPRPPEMVRSEVYLDYVREQPCMWCSAPGPSDPDHVGPHGLGQKTDDLRTVPACRACHTERTDTNRVSPHSKEDTMALVYRKQVDLLVGFFRLMAESVGE